MSDKRKILVVCDNDGRDEATLLCLKEQYEVVEAESAIRATDLLRRDDFAGVYLGSHHLDATLQVGTQLRNSRILEGLPDAVVLLDGNNRLLWSNGRLCQWTGREVHAGESFYAVMGDPEILGPDYSPFHTALSTGQATTSNLRTSDSRYYQVHAQPIYEQPGTNAEHLIVTVRDITLEIQQQQKLVAIHQAGMQLADLTPDDLLNMQVDERIELLKSNILQFTKDVLHYDFVELRLLDQESGSLTPLLAVGMEPEACSRSLFARPQNNGVTGFVAATGKSYLCENTADDPLYLKGAKNAKSSLTVPLVLHDQVIGTFNVESPEPRAFTEADLQFLEIFGHEVAMALNTLELLVAEKAGTTAASVEAIHSAVAMPVDEILNDAVNVMERYIGHGTELTDRLLRILKNARDIKQLIQRVGQKMAPSQAHPGLPSGERPLLSGRQVLVVDADESVRSAAHNLLERYGCIVETSHNGDEAVCMVRQLGPEHGYDAIISDIRLPDMNGYEFMQKLQQIIDPVPLVLMTGFGYDPCHAIVKARQAGLQAVLYKPFRLDQLLESVEKVVQMPRTAPQA